MATYLVTGGTGFLGRHLVRALRARGDAALVLTRKPIVPGQIAGDILKEGLGLEQDPGSLEAVWHLAALMDLGQDKSGRVWRTNVEGTRNVIAFCQTHSLPLYYVSTAYTFGRNPYERSKAECETLIEDSGVPAAIYKPSILIADSQTADPGGTRGFYQLVGVAARVHRRAELVRRRIEGTLRLPVLEPVLRIHGRPDALANLLPVDVAARWMVDHLALGKNFRLAYYWVTNPGAPKLSELAEWVGEAILLRIQFAEEFRATPIEALFARLTRSFAPYLFDGKLPSDILADAPMVTRELIQRSATRAVLHL